jgi:hypothetical protein
LHCAIDENKRQMISPTSHELLGSVANAAMAWFRLERIMALWSVPETYVSNVKDTAIMAWRTEAFTHAACGTMNCQKFCHRRVEDSRGAVLIRKYCV